MAKKVCSNKPKRATSAYIRFTLDMRQKETLEKMSIGEQAVRYSKMWADLPEQQKKKYIDAYQKDVVEYKKAMEKYKETDEYKEFLKIKGEEKRRGVSTKKEIREKKPRNVSSYNVFMAEVYEKKKREGKFDFREVATEASEEWKKMSKQNKEAYQKKADEKNQARREAMAS